MKNKLNNVLLGCIGDDFTGSSDAASFLAKEGIKTLLFNGIPKDNEELEDCAAIVIALKTRNVAPSKASKDTLQAMKWLEKQGIEQYYIKYCSTFDSTPKGNIGPDIDAALENYNIPYTVLCPSLPVNKRVVKNGILIVDGKPIAEGHMAHHPLNPIWASEISALMRDQGKYECLVLNEQIMNEKKEEILSVVNNFAKNHKHFYVIPEYATDEQGKKIVDVFGDLKLLTGGSGLLEFLADKYTQLYDCVEGDHEPTSVKGKGIALSGSCSTATCAQCNKYSSGKPSIAIYPEKLLTGEQSAEKVWNVVKKYPEQEFLIYSAGATDPKSRQYSTKEREMEASNVLETTMAQIARYAYNDGYTRIICAGGETSGAIALELGFDAFIIGQSIAPGVPVLTPLHNKNIRVVMKSGNFGQDDFFDRAFNITRD